MRYTNYWKNPAQQLESLKEIRYCENSIVNGIIGIYHAKAERAQIDFTYKTDVPAEFEQAEDFGFATMLSNLLENAFIAVCKVPDSQERKYLSGSNPKKNSSSSKSGIIILENWTFQGRRDFR